MPIWRLCLPARRSRASRLTPIRGSSTSIPAVAATIITSADRGQTWSAPRTIQPSLVGPAFEMCHAIVELPDGRWLAPTSTWRGWNGDAPNGMQCVAVVSHDRGQTWPEHVPVLNGCRDGLIYWEVSLGRLLDGRLLAACWVFDERNGKSRPNEFALSADGRGLPEFGEEYIP